MLVSTKNVFAPGAEFGAYSASKAGAHQLGRVAALEGAALGVRVNLVNADAVFGEPENPSGLWQEVGPARAAARGLAPEELEEFYRNRNLLKARVTPEHVGRAVVFFACQDTPTTGAVLPVDGGLPDAFPRVVLNAIFIALVAGAVLVAAFTGTMAATNQAALDAAKNAVMVVALGLVGPMALWLGFMRVLREAGFMASVARALAPVMRRLFPDVPAEHPAMGAMILNLSANVLGLGNAATPFGLKAMRELETLNPRPGVATNAMALFLAINTSGVAVLPLGVIAIRASLGSTNRRGDHRADPARDRLLDGRRRARGEAPAELPRCSRPSAPRSGLTDEPAPAAAARDRRASRPRSDRERHASGRPAAPRARRRVHGPARLRTRAPARLGRAFRDRLRRREARARQLAPARC